MDFKLTMRVPALEPPIALNDHILLAGSCFTNHMATRLRTLRFTTLENPNGIVFNPASIAHHLQRWFTGQQYTHADLFYHHELWQSWHFHSAFSHPDREVALEGMNRQLMHAHQFLKQANWVVITLGSAFVYQLKDDSLGGQPGQVAANCHKVPAQHFNHRLLSLVEVTNYLQQIIETVLAAHPQARVIFTISPVRHYREGLVENNRSKGLLHNAVGQVQQQYNRVHYFPAYELVIDDLRDYRFYAEDLVHPNYAATQYVWEQFKEGCLDARCQTWISRFEEVWRAFNHKPFHAQSQQHQQFLAQYAQKTAELQKDFPEQNLEELTAYFGPAPSR